mgnify:CR=1 FL=1
MGVVVCDGPVLLPLVVEGVLEDCAVGVVDITSAVLLLPAILLLVLASLLVCNDPELLLGVLAVQPLL